jgi:hypothetical protein
MKLKDILKPKITVEKHGDYINIYCWLGRQEYWYYTKKEALKLFKQKYNL